MVISDSSWSTIICANVSTAPTPPASFVVASKFISAILCTAPVGGALLAVVRNSKIGELKELVGDAEANRNICEESAFTISCTSASIPLLVVLSVIIESSCPSVASLMTDDIVE